MDRMLFLAMNGAQQSVLAHTTTAHNLANVNTVGFKADFDSFRSLPVYGPGHPARAYSADQRVGVDYRSGPMVSTGNPLDIAVQGGGWIAIQAPDGGEAYTRAGNLSISAEGLLTTGAGYPVLGNDGPIALPPAQHAAVGEDGTISIQPLGGEPNTLVVVDRIKLVAPPEASLEKDPDGLVRERDRQPLPPAAAVSLRFGVLEGSNVNAVDALVDMIDQQRRFEYQIRVMETAQENDSAGARLLRLRS